MITHSSTRKETLGKGKDRVIANLDPIEAKLISQQHPISPMEISVLNP